MKFYDDTRKIDELGRLVIPIEIRRRLSIEKGDPLEILVDDDSVILKKVQAVCVFCDSTDNLTEFKGKWVCWRCLKRICQSR